MIVASFAKDDTTAGAQGQSGAKELRSALMGRPRLFESSFNTETQRAQRPIYLSDNGYQMALTYVTNRNFENPADS
jgi:hypothetical protein